MEIPPGSPGRPKPTAVVGASPWRGAVGQVRIVWQLTNLAVEDFVTQLGSPATESGSSGDGRQAVRGSRLARRRRTLFWVAGGAALLAIGGLIGASFVKSPQQIAADTAAPPPTATTAKVVSQVLTSSVQMRGVVYPGTQYDVYPSAPESDSPASGTGSAAGGSAGGGTAGGGSAGSVYISKLEVAAGPLHGHHGKHGAAKPSPSHS